jgi:hypothetical protein
MPRAKMPEHLKKPRKQIMAEWNARNRDYYANYWLLSAYGITLAEYNVIFSSQSGLCKICNGEQQSGRRLSVDHDHETGRIRGLLCIKCNSFIGMAQENPDILHRAIEYLEDVEDE